MIKLFKRGERRGLQGANERQKERKRLLNAPFILPFDVMI